MSPLVMTTADGWRVEVAEIDGRTEYIVSRYGVAPIGKRARIFALATVAAMLGDSVATLAEAEPSQ